MSVYTSDHLLYVFIGVKGGEKLIIIFKNHDVFLTGIWASGLEKFFI